MKTHAVKVLPMFADDADVQISGCRFLERLACNCMADDGLCPLLLTSLKHTTRSWLPRQASLSSLRQ
jgi:hypothetical protein